jgi:hypothetical protein
LPTRANIQGKKARRVHSERTRHDRGEISEVSPSRESIASQPFIVN